MKIGIIKYNAGNVCSVENALQRLGVETLVSCDEMELNACDKIIFPGVGQAATAMQYLKEKQLDGIIRSFKQPVLGICLGMQLMCDFSEEGNTTCLGIFNQNIKKFNLNLKTPQTGWNEINKLKDVQLFLNINENECMYFVHSYYAELSAYTIAQTNYGIDFSSALKKDNFYGTQFHPEKSGLMGQTILENFIKFT